MRSSPSPPLVIVLLVSFLLCLTGIGRESLWRDEVDSIRFAAEAWTELAGSETVAGAVSQLPHYLTRPGWNGPLYFLLMEPWLRVAGKSELALRLPSALAGVAAVALSYVMGTRLGGATVGRLSALLMAANPYLAWYAGEGKMYSMIAALALLSTYLLMKACGSGHRRFWLGYVLVTSLLFYTHILTPLLLPVQAILVLLRCPRAAVSREALVSGGALVLPYLPLLLWQWPHVAQPAETGFPFVSLPTMGQRMGEVFSRGIIGWPAALPLILLLGAMGLGVVAFLRPGKELALSMGMMVWAGLPILELYLVSLRRPLFTERYLIWTLPAWLMLASRGLAGLARRGRAGRLAAAGWTAGLVTIGILGIGYQWGTPVRADFRSAASWVANHYQADELIVFQIPYLQATFDYYAPELAYQAAEGPYTNWGNPAEETEAYLQSVTAGYDRVWLVLSEVPMWDARGLTLGWFQSHARLVREAMFNRVQVIQWEWNHEP
jgi:mannosyltransferase